MEPTAKLIHRWCDYELFRTGDKIVLVNLRTGERRSLKQEQARRWIRDHGYQTTTGKIETIINTK